jgi:hypothetical protein
MFVKFILWHIKIMNLGIKIQIYLLAIFWSSQLYIYLVLEYHFKISIPAAFQYGAFVKPFTLVSDDAKLYSLYCKSRYSMVW